MSKVLLHIIVSHRSNPHPDDTSQWLDDDRIRSIVTSKDTADLCAPLVASASPVRIHRTGSHGQPPAVCCEATVQAVRPRGTLFEVEFTNARTLNLAPAIRPDGKESCYFIEAGGAGPGEVGDSVNSADAATDEAARSQTEPSAQLNSNPALLPAKTATQDSSASAKRESRPPSMHLELLQRGIEHWNFARRRKPDVKPNLQGCDLREVLGRARIEAFGNAGVQLAGADMRGANLAGLIFRRPVLCDVSFAGADLTGAKWRSADRSFIGSAAASTKCGVDLRAANLEGANLSLTTFEEPWLVGTNFRGAKIVDVDFSGSRLKGICFDGAVLLNANLRGADLTDASFKGADLRAADLSTATVTRQQVAQAITDRDTKLPVDWEF